MKIKITTFESDVYISIESETSSELAALINLTMNHKKGEPNNFYCVIPRLPDENNARLELSFQLVDSGIRKQFIEKK